MKARIQHWLGITALRAQQQQIITLLNSLETNTNRLACGLEDEFSKTRKSVSDQIGAKAIKRMQDEAAARKLTTDGNW